MDDLVDQLLLDRLQRHEDAEELAEPPALLGNSLGHVVLQHEQHILAYVLDLLLLDYPFDVCVQDETAGNYLYAQLPSFFFANDLVKFQCQ